MSTPATKKVPRRAAATFTAAMLAATGLVYAHPGDVAYATDYPVKVLSPTYGQRMTRTSITVEGEAGDGIELVGVTLHQGKDVGPAAAIYDNALAEVRKGLWSVDLQNLPHGWWTVRAADMTRGDAGSDDPDNVAIKDKIKNIEDKPKVDYINDSIIIEDYRDKFEEEINNNKINKEITQNIDIDLNKELDLSNNKNITVNLDKGLVFNKDNEILFEAKDSTPTVHRVSFEIVAQQNPPPGTNQSQAPSAQRQVVFRQHRRPNGRVVDRDARGRAGVYVLTFRVFEQGTNQRVPATAGRARLVRENGRPLTDWVRPDRQGRVSLRWNPRNNHPTGNVRARIQYQGQNSRWANRQSRNVWGVRVVR